LMLWLRQPCNHKAAAKLPLFHLFPQCKWFEARSCHQYFEDNNDKGDHD
jgi:hypothetical protein